MKELGSQPWHLPQAVRPGHRRSAEGTLLSEGHRGLAGTPVGAEAGTRWRGCLGNAQLLVPDFKNKPVDKTWSQEASLSKRHIIPLLPLPQTRLRGFAAPTVLGVSCQNPTSTSVSLWALSPWALPPTKNNILYEYFTHLDFIPQDCGWFLVKWEVSLLFKKIDLPIENGVLNKKQICLFFSL